MNFSSQQNSYGGLTGIEVVLFQPRIPQNTGNIGRLCVGFGAQLCLIHPLGFSLESRLLKRAGLDYWSFLKYQQYSSFPEFMLSRLHRTAVCISKYGSTTIYDHSFSADTLLVFGNETDGFPEMLTEKYRIQRLNIPMAGNIRSYNLANSAAIVLSEVWRQRYASVLSDQKKTTGSSG